MHLKWCVALAAFSNISRTRFIAYRHVRVPDLSTLLANDDLQEWNGLFFEKTTLQSLGLVIQLGHNPGEACPAPTPSPRASMVIDTNGFHPVNLQYCQCSQMARAGDTTEQLIRAELVGATLTDPSTFCTVRVLDHFHLLTLQSKITVYDFYMTLQKLTDIAGIRHGYVSTSSTPQYNTYCNGSRIDSGLSCALCANGDT